MRLIDADALPSALFQKHVHDEEELEPMLYFEDAVKVVENALTVDAIPVEWLDWRIMNAKYNGIKEAADAFEFVLNCYKEQEMQDVGP